MATGKHVNTEWRDQPLNPFLVKRPRGRHGRGVLAGALVLYARLLYRGTTAVKRGR